MQARKHLRNKKRQGGFTLPEVLVVLCLTSMLFTFFLQCFFFWSEQYQNRSALEELEDNLLIAIESMAQDIGRSTGILTWEQESITLVSGYHEKETVAWSLGKDGQAEEHFYALEGKILYRLESTQRVRQPIANFIDTLTISCLNRQGLPAQKAEDVYAVHVKITGVWKNRTLKQEQIIRLAGTAYL